jgi:methionyl-tRNA formyltransferase
MRLLFFGNSPNSLTCLDSLLRARGIKVVGVVTPTGRRLGTLAGARWKARRALVQATPRPSRRHSAILRLGHLATHAGVPWLTPESVNHPDTIASLADLRADAVVMMGFNQILKRPLLQHLPPVLNVHPSLLPSYRGPAPCFWTVARGESESGATVHRVDEGVDTGPILRQGRIAVTPWMTGGDLRDEVNRLGTHLLLQTLRAGLDDGRRPSDSGSYFGQVRREDLEVPVGLPARQAFDRARAAAPERGLWLRLPKKLAEGLAARPTSTDDALTVEAFGPELYAEHDLGAPGTVLRRGNALVVACATGCVLFRHIPAFTRPPTET